MDETYNGFRTYLPNKGSYCDANTINPATKDPKKGDAGYRRQSLVFLDAGSESGMTGWSI